MDNPVNCRANTCTNDPIGVYPPRGSHLSNNKQARSPRGSAGGEVRVWSCSETTGAVKPGRKHLANTARTPVEGIQAEGRCLSGAWQAIAARRFAGQADAKFWDRMAAKPFDPLVSPTVPRGDRVKRDNSKLIVFARGRHAIRISDLSTRW